MRLDGRNGKCTLVNARAETDLEGRCGTAVGKIMQIFRRRDEGTHPSNN